MDEQSAYLLGLLLTPGIGTARLERLLRRFGGARTAWHASPAALRQAGLDDDSVAALVKLRQTLNPCERAAALRASGVRLLRLGTPDYPELLANIPQPPQLLFVRGQLLPADAWAVAVVGTRKPTTYGKEAVRLLVAELAAAGVTIVSGLALGIDGKAHEAALEHGGRTIAVLGSGHGHVYPYKHKRLAEQIVQRGALLSEYPPEMRPIPSNFPARNRIISGLSRGTLVIEAAEQSGSLITVEFALEQGRDAFAVPGSIFSNLSAGTNTLIAKGALAVHSAQQILEALNWTHAAAQRQAQTAIPANPTEAQTLAALDREPQHIDDIGQRCGILPAELAATLALLELKGLARQVGGLVYVRA